MPGQLTIPEMPAIRPPSFFGRMRGVIVNVGLLFLSVLAVCLVGEIIIRAALPQQLILKRLDIWQPHDTLGWVHLSNVRTTVNTGERTVAFVTDQDGFRVGREGRVEADRGILLLGDSFLEALQVEYEHSIPGLLEERLPALVGVPVAVRNTAVGGWGPNRYYLQARALLEREDFDLVLVMLFVANDVVKTRVDRVSPYVAKQVHPLRLPRRLTQAEIIDAIFYPINDFFEVRSHLFVLLKTRSQSLLMKLGLSEARFQDVFLRSERTAERWIVTAEICKDIAALAEHRGIPTLFVLLPASYQVDASILAEYALGFGLDSTRIDMDQPNRILGELLRAEGLTVFDALPVLRDAYSKGLKPYGTIDRHLSPEGHDIVERFIEPSVASSLQPGYAATGDDS